MFVTRARILLVDSDELEHRAIEDSLVEEGYEVIHARGVAECSAQLELFWPDAVVLDHFLKDGTALDLIRQLKQFDPNIPILVLADHDTVDLAQRTIKDGAHQLLIKPVETRMLAALIENVIKNERTRRKQVAYAASRAQYRRDPFLGTSSVIRRLSEEAHKFASSDLPVLIHGETGTGKGVLAEWIHQNSPRTDGAFVDINCAALSKELLESELFGHEKGSFTSATGSKVGLLEIAHKGTAFLDELGDMDITIQAKLLSAHFG